MRAVSGRTAYLKVRLPDGVGTTGATGMLGDQGPRDPQPGALTGQANRLSYRRLAYSYRLLPSQGKASMAPQSHADRPQTVQKLKPGVSKSAAMTVRWSSPTVAKRYQHVDDAVVGNALCE